MNKIKNLFAGIVKNNPTFVLLLGMCPTLATTTSAVNGAGMGAATMAVLIMSNTIIALVKDIIPSKIRIPAYIVIIAALVTMVELAMKAYLPGLSKTLGVFIPLIVVNCIILGRAEGFAAKNSVLDSALDGIGVGLGFTLSLTVIGAIREMLGSGAIFGQRFISGDGMLIFVLAPGAFIVLGYLMVMFNKLTAKMK
jgi:electron transport complex protein RnfE